jgi:hypothetical protein
MRFPRYTAQPKESLSAGPRSSGTPFVGSVAPAIGGIGKELQRADELRFRADYKRKALDDEIQFALGTQKTQEAYRFELDTIDKTDFALDEPVSQSDPDYFSKLMSVTAAEKDKLFAEASKNARDKISQLGRAFKTKEAQQNFEAWKISHLADFDAQIKTAIDKKYHDYQYAKLDKIRMEMLENGDIEGADKLVDLMDQNEIITAVGANAIKEQNAKLFTEFKKRQGEQAIDSIKPLIVDALGPDMSDKQTAMQIIEANLDGLVKNGIIDDVQSAEGLRNLNNYMKDVAQEYKQSTEMNIIQTYESFADKLAEGTFTGDDIALSGLNETQKKDFDGILEGKRRPAPTQSTYEGMNNLTQIVTDYAAGVVGKKEALAKIMEQRYVLDAVNDDAYKWALSRVKEKYPVHIAATIKGALQEAENVLYHKGAGFFGNDWLDREEKEKIIEVKSSLLSWMEGVKTDTGKFPEPEQIYKFVNSQGIAVNTPKNLPVQRVVPKAAPKKGDPLYVVTDEDFASVPVGAQFYSELLGEWVIKESE